MRYLLVIGTMVLLGIAALAADEKGEHKAGDVKIVDLGGGVKMDFVWCPPGEFMMGGKGSRGEKPARSVRIPQGFWLGKCEVTKAQWKTCMRSEPWKGQANVLDDPNSPAVYMNWNDAQALCRQLGNEFHLPSEAQWEYACRAGSTTEYCFGDDENLLTDYAWYEKNAKEVDEAYAHPVAQKKPNNWGLYDMHGNVWEWCQDCYYYKRPGATSDEGVQESPTDGERVLRGGSWSFNPYACRAAFGAVGTPNMHNANFGLRLLRDP